MEPSSACNLAELGRRVRAARVARRLTLEEAISRTNFTVSWLSKVENGLLSPSLEGLVRLAEALECPLESLVSGLQSTPRSVVVRRGDGARSPSRSGRGLTAEVLAERWVGRTMRPVILHVTGSGARRQPESHAGERFFLVLEGEVRFTYGDDVLQLSPGDSIYIDAAIPHSVGPTAGARSQAIRVLCVAYEPEAGRTAPPKPHGRPPRRTAARPTLAASPNGESP
jgi:mannose-6-phosphate isomerase-like protein (cupin superfamily)